jgi:hypothetical protein
MTKPVKTSTYCCDRDSILRKHEEAITRLRRILDPVLCGSEAQVRKAVKVLDALSLFHPTCGESWPGWPEDED